MEAVKVEIMEALIKEYKDCKEIAVLGNSPQIKDIDFSKLDQMVTIGVNAIGRIYVPDILLWVENAILFRDDLKNTESKYKICRRGSGLGIKNAIEFDSVSHFGHKWEGGLRGSPSVHTAIHLAMILTKKIYIAGVDYFKNEYFYDRVNLKWEQMVKIHLIYFALLREENKKSKILFCSELSIVPGFEKTIDLNKTRN